MSEIRLDSKHAEIRIRIQTDIRFHRFPVRPQGGQGQTHSRLLEDLKLETSEASPSLLSQTAHVCNKPFNSDREISPPS